MEKLVSASVPSEMLSWRTHQGIQGKTHLGKYLLLKEKKKKKKKRVLLNRIITDYYY
jgi:hypothetical protein